MNVLDLFTTKKSSADGGDPTAAYNGVSEADGTDFSAVGSFLNQVANTYSTVKTALNDKQAGPASVPAQATPAVAPKSKTLFYVLGGAAVLLVVFLVLKRR